jgi:hypothetical protein
MMRRDQLVEALAVLVFFVLVTGLVCWPVPVELGSAVIGSVPGDAGGTVWWLDALQTTGYHLFGTTTFHDIAVPRGYDQANSLNLQSLLPYYPTYLATKVVGEVAAYNLCVLSGLALSGVSMYVLARRIGAVPAVASWAGLAWLLFPWHVMRAEGHAAYVHTWCLPLVALAVHAYWRRASPTGLALVGLSVLACWLTAGIFGVMALVVVLACAITAVGLTRARRDGLVSGALLAATAVAASGLVYVLALPGGGDGGVGASRSLVDLRRFGLRLEELVVPAADNSFLGGPLARYHADRLHGSQQVEVSNYVGWVTITLAGVGLVALWRTRATRDRAGLMLGTGLGVSALVALALALPSPTWVLGHRIDRTPARLLFDAVPAFRVPARWTVVIMLAAVTLGTIGLQTLWNEIRRGRGRWAPYVLAGGVVALTAVELSSHVGHSEGRISAAPPEYGLLTRTPPGTLAEYPLWRNDTIWNSAYLFWQRAHRRPLVNGADVNSSADVFRRALIDPRAPGVAAQLAALGTTAITTRDSTPHDIERLRRLGFALVGTTDDDVSVWRVTAPPAPAVVTLSREFQDPDPWKDRSVQRLFGSEGYIEILARKPTRGVLSLTVLAMGTRTRRVTIGPRSFDVAAGGTPVRIPFSARRGATRVPIRVDGIPVDEVGIATTVPALVPGRAEPTPESVTQ